MMSFEICLLHRDASTDARVSSECEIRIRQATSAGDMDDSAGYCYVM